MHFEELENKIKTPDKELYTPIPGEIISIKDLSSTEKLFRIALLNNRSLNHLPGQFIELSIFGKGEAPISICSSPSRGPEFEIIVRKTGRLTAELHKYKPGSQIGIRGPFGKGFNVESFESNNLLLIAGGIGIVPLRSLIQHVIDSRKKYNTVTLLYGSKTPSDIILKDEFKEWKDASIDIKLTVDDTNDASWNGNTGLITDLIIPLEIDVTKTFVNIVGPPAMYKPVIKELEGKNIPHSNIFLSLERYMKCGVGKCGHCTIDHLYCCTDGPVFCYEEINSSKGNLCLKY